MKKLIKTLAIITLSTSILLTSCQNSNGGQTIEIPLPSPGDDMFGVDTNINIETIDNYLGIEDVVYVDMRMFIDTARYEDIGGESVLTKTIEGFKIIPFPYIATMAALPVEGAFVGDTLFDVEWGNGTEILSVTENYKESMLILDELFPKDKKIFIMCGGAGYAGMTRALLIHLGWNEDLLYNVGAGWFYDGENALELVKFPEDANDPNIYATWRADYAYFDFNLMTPVA